MGAGVEALRAVAGVEQERLAALDLSELVLQALDLSGSYTHTRSVQKVSVYLRGCNKRRKAFDFRKHSV